MFDINSSKKTIPPLLNDYKLSRNLENTKTYKAHFGITPQLFQSLKNYNQIKITHYFSANAAQSH
jgi:hypothetical protein